MKRFCALFLAIGLGLSASFAQAENLKHEFFMSCTYGVLAGTLVGTASLAFTNKPKDNLNRVARGASIGLYAGILLGLYVVYIIPGLQAPPDDGLPQSVQLDRVPLRLTPLISENGWDGLRADWTIRRF